MATLDIQQSDLVVAKANKVLGSAAVERYTEQRINVHYSLLPSYAGLTGTRPVQAARDHPVDIEALGRNCRFNGSGFIESQFPSDEES